MKLRAPELSDLDLLFELENDREQWLTSNTRAPLSRAALKQFIVRSAQYDLFALRQQRFVIEVTDGGKPSAIGIHRFDWTSRLSTIVQKWGSSFCRPIVDGVMAKSAANVGRLCARSVDAAWFVCFCPHRQHALPQSFPFGGIRGGRYAQRLVFLCGELPRRTAIPEKTPLISLCVMRKCVFCTALNAKYIRCVSSAGRIHACHAWGHGSESRTHRLKSPATPMSRRMICFGRRS